jgi:tetratricopeptide (TPR) repeat protein
MKKTIVVLLLWGWFSFNPATAQSASTSYDQGLALYANGEYSTAVKKFQKALKSGGHHWQVLQALGDCWLKLQDADKALDYYRQSLKLHPDNPTLDYYVSSHQTVFNPHLPPPQPGEGNKPTRGIEFSFTIGQIYFFQSSVLGLTSTAGPWQASFYLGVQPTPDWACGIQVDYLDFRPNGLDPSIQNNYAAGSFSDVSGPFDLTAGNISLNLKVYPFSATSPFPVYLVGGGGLFVIQRQYTTIMEYTNYGQAYDTTTFPATLQAGPSLDGGLGVAYKIDDNARVLGEFRAVDVFLSQPIYYGTLNVGVLYLF